jgi:hypothetical protein
LKPLSAQAGVASQSASITVIMTIRITTSFFTDYCILPWNLQTGKNIIDRSKYRGVRFVIS